MEFQGFQDFFKLSKSKEKYLIDIIEVNFEIKNETISDIRSGLFSFFNILEDYKYLLKLSIDFSK